MSKVQPTADYWTNDVKSTPRCRLLNRWPKKPGDEIVLFLLSRKTKSSLPPLRVWKYFEYLECVIHLDLQNSSYLMYQSIPKPPIPLRAIPGHLTRIKFRRVGNLTQNEARPVGFDFRVKTSVSGRKQNSLIQQVSRVHGSLLLSIPCRFFFCRCLM